MTLKGLDKPGHEYDKKERYAYHIFFIKRAKYRQTRRDFTRYMRLKLTSIFLNLVCQFF